MIRQAIADGVDDQGHTGKFGVVFMPPLPANDPDLRRYPSLAFELQQRHAKSYIRIEEDYSPWPEYQDFRALRLGISWEPEHEADGYPIRTYTYPNGHQITLLVLCELGYFEEQQGHHGFGQIDWRDGKTPAFTLGGLDPARSHLTDYQRAWEALRLLSHIVVKTAKSGQRTLEDKPDHPWRHFADQAIEIRKRDPFLSLAVLVERLGLASENGEDRTKTLGRWINRRLLELNEKNPS